jgi:hypothetical protein
MLILSKQFLLSHCIMTPFLTSWCMVRTQVQLTDRQAEALRRRSKRENVSVAELVRRAIEAFTRAEPPSERELRDRAIRVAGRFASGVHDTSTRHDEVLAEAFHSL